jgi:hypothetical protein
LKLIFHIQDKKPKTFIIDKETVTIGRDEGCDVVLPYAGFSRKHAEINLIHDEIYVTDLGSTNGVHINGERIPPYEKTKTQSYLGLQIGPATQVEIITEEESAQIPVVNKKAEITGTNTNLSINQSSHVTRTTVLDISNSKSGVKKKAPKKEFPKNEIFIFLAILLVIGLGYVYTSGNDDVEVDSQLVEVNPATVNAPTETEFLTKTVLDSIYKKASCDSDMAKWCEAGGLKVASKEGVVIESKTLVVYLNMDSFVNEFHGEVFNQMDLGQRLEILALKRVFFSNLLSTYLRQNLLDTLQVVVGNIKEDQYSPSTVFKFKRDLGVERIEKFRILGLFDQILNEGNADALIDISLLYDKAAL